MGRTTAILGIATAATLIAASPASATTSICDSPSRSALLAGAAGLPTGIAGRGGDVREPQLDQLHTDMPALAKGKAGKDFTATIRVYLHVITAGGVGNLTNAQIAAQMNVLRQLLHGVHTGPDAAHARRVAALPRANMSMCPTCPRAGGRSARLRTPSPRPTAAHSAISSCPRSASTC